MNKITWHQIIFIDQCKYETLTGRKFSLEIFLTWISLSMVGTCWFMRYFTLLVVYTCSYCDLLSEIWHSSKQCCLKPTLQITHYAILMACSWILLNVHVVLSCWFQSCTWWVEMYFLGKKWFKANNFDFSLKSSSKLIYFSSSIGNLIVLVTYKMVIIVSTVECEWTEFSATFFLIFHCRAYGK